MTFEEFADVRLPALLRFAGVLTGDRALAEDVVQEALIRAHGRWKAIGQLDRPESYVRNAAAGVVTAVTVTGAPAKPQTDAASVRTAVLTAFSSARGGNRGCISP
jgi:Sigma-70 region 2